MDLEKEELHKKISILAKKKGFTQQELADKCQISRISVHRYFKGQTELRAKDVIRILELLGLTIEGSIDYLINQENNQDEALEEPLIHEVSQVLKHLEGRVRKTLIEQIAWWAKLSSTQPPSLALDRLNQYVNNSAS